MQLIHLYSSSLHIAIGSLALLIFWVPVFARKGSLDHRRFGRYFAMAMYAVALSGFVMAGLDLVAPLTMHPSTGTLTAESAAAMAREIRVVALFLLSLSVLVFVSARQGWLAILHKENRTALRTPWHISLCLMLAFVGLAVLAAGILYDQLLYLIFGPLEIFVGLSMLHYSFKKQLRPKEWWTEHLGGLIGAGIGAYTAFFVFGGTRLLNGLFQDALADMAIVLWVGPGVVGGIATALLTRHYRRRFGKVSPGQTDYAADSRVST